MTLFSVCTVCHGYLERDLILDDLLVRTAEHTVYRVLEGTVERPEVLFMNDHAIRAK